MARFRQVAWHSPGAAIGPDSGPEVSSPLGFDEHTGTALISVDTQTGKQVEYAISHHGFVIDRAEATVLQEGRARLVEGRESDPAASPPSKQGEKTPDTFQDGIASTSSSLIPILRAALQCCENTNWLHHCEVAVDCRFEVDRGPLDVRREESVGSDGVVRVYPSSWT